ncbi:hypothetical protein EVAR_47054_1 [Eumeta japonica]|uniref:Uncharacterized protein n=1 Tax=Eumeta variegata TaxID=151549 RepID=A0A4C1WP43_EUMVA|nr:hypothetical protein EVAR_47054_1 [Eumeta japonica]
MSYDRYILLTKCLHFSDNDKQSLPNVKSKQPLAASKQPLTDSKQLPADNREENVRRKTITMKKVSTIVINELRLRGAEPEVGDKSVDAKVKN